MKTTPSGISKDKAGMTIKSIAEGSDEDSIIINIKVEILYDNVDSGGKRRRQYSRLKQFKIDSKRNDSK
jgi:hypothetical protein